MTTRSIGSRADALVAAGNYRAGADLLTNAADAGDGDALLELARWRVYGSVLGRDLGVARTLLASAGAAGHLEAALLHCGFLASGIGGPPDWAAARSALDALAPRLAPAAAQVRLLDAMDLDDNGFPAAKPVRRTLSDMPAAFTSPGLLKPAECEWLIAAAKKRLVRSTVVDPATGRMVPHPVRTCDYAMFGVFDEDMVIGAINRRIASLTGTGPAQGEALQVLSYRVGGEYRPHFDALHPTDNQRILTALVYLNDDYEGGETQFNRTGLAFRGAAGDALVFRNVAPDGRPDPLSQHAGLPVTRGVKFLASRWIRERPVTFPPPMPALPD